MPFKESDLRRWATESGFARLDNIGLGRYADVGRSLIHSCIDRIDIFPFEKPATSTCRPTPTPASPRNLQTPTA